MNRQENIFPVELIKDENKRKEFLSEYKRLLSRIGRGAMEKNFILYMNEEKLNSGEIKMQFCGYENTCEIIARLVESGHADFYLSPEPQSRNVPMTVLNKNTVLVTQTEGLDPTQPVVTALIKNASKEVMDFEENRFNEILQRSQLIRKEKIREVFTQIDNKFAGK